ncbi:hypothetical protein [Rhodococcus globerulus]|uniref:hypothetical protein n=1 Tax=Rhodococcus globerulus TaxID=33008 RepID=UPI003017E25C
MALAEVTYESVLAAIADYDQLGQDTFLSTYSFAPARTYRLAYAGRFYDSKAIVGVAHGHATGTYWTATDFSGGAKTVGRTLTRLGFVIDTTPAVDIDADGHGSDTTPPLLSRSVGGALEGLANLPVATYQGRRAPYQYVVLLWAIARARTGAPRMVHFQDAATELRSLLAPFALAASAPNPANPWAALKDSPWWQIDPPAEFTDGPLDWKQVPALDPPAGLSAPIYETIRTDPIWAGQAVDVITRIIGEHPAYEALFEGLGLTTIRTLTADGAIVTSIPLENTPTEHFTTDATDPSPQERQRREAVLQDSYVQHLRSLGHLVNRRRITLPGTTLFTDIYDETAATVIEVKASVDRPTIRTALGQILDYGRYIAHDRKTILLPDRPGDDLIALLHSCEVSVVWQSGTVTFDSAHP